ncbi:MAG TPA: electron transport complex subunit RsxC [Treponema sp.]|nr:electron transport complex subunit RsxC [Treponema sp.]HBB43277.1 electron transport complex subunit RsxC [Treponema sp.]
MKTHTFRGGIRPHEMKELSNGCPITEAFPSTKSVTIPVTMGGAPNTPLVKVGDVVKRGQVIAKSDAFMSAPVHASISGKVKKIQTCLVTGNTEAPCITIESDGSEETDFMPPLDPFTCDKKTALDRIRDAGIVGMGGASFPTHVKLNPPAEKKIDYVLLNAAECEPYLTVDERTLQEQSEKVIDGMKIVCHIMGDCKGLIALENNKEYIVPALKKAISDAGAENTVAVSLVKTKYPQGCEKNIVDAVLGVEIPAGRLPADAGAVITNVGTVCAISDAFRLGMPLIDRALTISGGAVDKPCNIRVPVGTIVGDLIPETFNLKEGETAKIVSGGPMMGFAMTSTQFPIAKGTSGITFLTKKETYLTDEGQCISCGKCIDACPMGLSPVLMVREIKSVNLDKAKKFGLMDCIECGCCSYACPANVRLVQHFRLGKNQVRAQMALEKAKAEAAKNLAQKAAEESGGKK